MKLSTQLFLVALTGVGLFSLAGYLDHRGRGLQVEETTGGSPKQIYPKYVGLGSGHGFGLGVTYRVERKVVVDGMYYAVVRSHEPGVEIYSLIPAVRDLPVGTRFTINDSATNFDDAVRVVSK